MTSRKTAADLGLPDHYKVRVVVDGALLHLASRNEPQPIYADGRLADVHADWFCHPDTGDRLGYIDWTQVAALTWRWAGTAPDPAAPPCAALSTAGTDLL